MPALDTFRENHLEIYQPRIIVATFMELDTKELVRQGVTCLLLDGESTLFPYDSLIVPRLVIDKLDEARDHGITALGIITNKEPKDRVTVCQLKSWTEQLDGDVTVFPFAREFRKANSYMMLQAMQHLNRKPQECAAGGDKFSDVIAANFAEAAYSIYFEKRLGWDDHIGDRVKRLYQKIFVLSGLVQEHPEPIIVPERFRSHVGSDRVVAPNKKPLAFDVPEVLKVDSKLAGIGDLEINLTPENIALLPAPRFETAKKAMKVAKKTLHSDKLDAYLYENGRELANTVTRTREKTGKLSARLFFAAEVLHLPKLKKFAIRLYEGSALADKLDGWLSRKGKDGPSSEARKEGGSLDDKADKEVSKEIGASLFLTHRKPLAVILGILGRDVYRNKIQRPHYKKSGHDTSATLSGQLSTFIEIAANIVGMKSNNKLLRNILHFGAFAAKMYSISPWGSPKKWKLRKAKADMANAMEQRSI